MTSLREIERALVEALPAELQEEALELAHFLFDLTVNPENTKDVQTKLNNNKKIQGALQVLAGRDIRIDSSLISFGTGSQIGDITIGDVAGGNIYKITVNIQLASSKKRFNSDITEKRINQIWEQANILISEEHWEDAERLLTQIEKINPLFGNIKPKLEEVRKQVMAIKYYRSLCQIEEARWYDVKLGLGVLTHKFPNFRDTHNLKGWIHQQEERMLQQKKAQKAFDNNHWEEAVDILKRILAEFPENEEAEELLRRVLRAIEEEHHLHILPEERVRLREERRRMANTEQKRKHFSQQIEHQNNSKERTSDISITIVVFVILIITIIILLYYIQLAW